MALAHRAYADALEEEPEPEPEPEFPWPLAGEVGCQFDEADLDVIEPPNGVLVVNEPTTIDHAYVKGGINFGGHGQLTIRNSIIEGGYGWDRHIQAYQPDSRVEVTDTTIRSLPDFRPSGVGGVYGLGSVVARHCDISGAVDGFKTGSHSVIHHCRIHDLRAGLDGHCDGVQLADAEDVVISSCFIEVHPLEQFDTNVHNAAIWIAPWENGKTVRDVDVDSCYLAGGLYAFKLHSGLATDVSIENIGVYECTFGPHPPGGGYTRIEGPRSEITEWLDNVDVDGNPL